MTVGTAPVLAHALPQRNTQPDSGGGTDHLRRHRQTGWIRAVVRCKRSTQVVGTERQTDGEADGGRRMLSRSAGKAGRQQTFQVTRGRHSQRGQVP